MSNIILSTECNRGAIVDAQQTSRVRELTVAELDCVNGGRGSLLGATLMAVVDAVFDGVVKPAIQNGGHSPLFPFI